MRAKVDDFAYVLVAAVVILAVLLAIFALIPPGGIGLTTPIENFTLGSVGFTGENVDVIPYGSFRVGDVNTETLRSIPQIQVSSSYLGGKTDSEEVKILNAFVPLTREATITFTVYDSTPAYGKLIIKWNGQELYNNGASRGAYTLHINRQYIYEANSLEISCDGPGAYFWAATTYILRDFKVNLDYGTMKLLPFIMNAKELESFKNGAIEFSNPYNEQGRLTIKVNGAQVFSTTPGPSESVKFDLFNVGITPGNNMITMSVLGDPIPLKNVALKIFVSTDNIIKERTINIPQSTFDLFSQGYRGRLEFDVDRITRQGSLSIRLNDKDLGVPTVEKGTNTVFFSANEAAEGDNNLKFSGTGGWEVGEVRILMER
jgi:hypothetical protein